MLENLRWQDFTPGARFDLGAVSLTADEIKDFARVYDPQPFHLDEDAAKKSVLGVLASSGWHSIALAKKRMVETVLNTPAYGGALAYGEVRWKKPVPADTQLHIAVEVASQNTASPLPGYGTVSFSGIVQGDDGAQFLTFEMDVAMKVEAA